MPEPGIGGAPERDGFGGSRQGPESQNSRGEGFAGIGGTRDGGKSRVGGKGRGLPSGFEAFLLSKGLTLADFFAFGGRGGRGGRGPSGEALSRLGQRRAESSRLGQSKTLLSSVDADANIRRPTLLG